MIRAPFSDASEKRFSLSNPAYTSSSCKTHREKRFCEASLSQLSNQIGKLFFELYYARALYREDKFDSALRFLDQIPSRAGRDWVRAWILTEFPDRHEEALASFRPSIKAFPGWMASNDYASLLYFIGRTDDARQELREARAEMDNARPSERASWTYLSNPSPEAARKYITAVAHSQTSLGRAHFLIGLARLARGDREGAQRAFADCVETRIFMDGSYDLARCFLARMNRDPHWPPWIPGKNEAAP